MERGLVYAVLGPLEVRLGGRLVPVRGRREQAVLAMLLLADGGPVTVERLADAVWDRDPPYGAAKAVRNCVSALRRRNAGPNGPAIGIEPTPAGYRLPSDQSRLDARDFRRQADTARQLATAGQTTQAAAGLRAALALWRGPALAGINGTIVQACAARLDEARMSVLEDCLNLELALGRHRHLVSDLQALASEFPLREQIVGQLMLALYRSGRQAEALDVHNRLAKRLAEDLGLDPSPGISRLHEAILRQHPALDFHPEPESARTIAPRPRPKMSASFLTATGYSRTNGNSHRSQ